MTHKIIELILLLIAITNIFSGIMWMFTDPTDHWLWFSRFALGVISLGFCGIINKINYVEKDK